MQITKPRKYQEEAVWAIFNYFYEGSRGNPLVVAPTGSGKTHIIAHFCEEVKKRWGNQKILIISHVKEILQQDYKAIKKYLPNKEIGLYSAGLKSKQIRDITIAGIQSIYDKPQLFDQFNIIIVDEAHLIPPGADSMYRKLFSTVSVPIVGLTATPYRLGLGYLHIGANAFFDEIVYTIKIKELQEKGYLCKLSTKGTRKKLDASEIKKQAGDFIIKELSKAFDRKKITKEIIQELKIYKQLRKKWLVFAIDINHCEHISEELNTNGIKAGFIHSKMKENRDEVISNFKKGEYQVLVSVAILTTGFDAPDVDLIAILRPTASPVLHVQMIGRGLRPYPNKKNCLILDFAGNLIRNGPIDAPIIKLKGKGTGEAILKECDNCYEIVHAAVRVCPICNVPFKFKHKLTSFSADREVLSYENWHEVKEVIYYKYIGRRGIPMLKVRYFIGASSFNEFICFEHGGYAAYKAQFWWKRRSKEPPPRTAEEAYKLSDTLAIPEKILVDEGGKFPVIKNHQF